MPHIVGAYMYIHVCAVCTERVLTCVLCESNYTKYTSVPIADFATLSTYAIPAYTARLALVARGEEPCGLTTYYPSVALGKIWLGFWSPMLGFGMIWNIKRSCVFMLPGSPSR